jgi:hypothetical protein
MVFNLIFEKIIILGLLAAPLTKLWNYFFSEEIVRVTHKLYVSH